ncbi:glycosyltransferase family 39 protein [Sphingomicrobium sp. XHP0235]|uniref:ArnT family glycosyltransferase n=1 Tax=Sphingomicrobium aquimarinum TaxID=3133971 RepID=UPI0031FF2D0B
MADESESVTGMAGAGVWLGAAALFAIICVLINPVGYVGGGADDQHYLAAARCWVEAGAPCLPRDHWWSRWPIVGPVALSIKVFGDTRVAVGIGSLWSWVAALVALGGLTAHWFGRRAGGIAVAAMAAVPIFTSYALTPDPNTAELAFQLGALWAAAVAFDRQSRPMAILGGAFGGLAFLTRETSLVFLAACAIFWLVLDKSRRRVLLWSILGFIGVVAAEILFYTLATGEPLYRYQLAMGHTGIPSRELPAGFDTNASPLFNPDYIRNWRREAGIHVFWPIDGWLNTLVTPNVGMIFWTALLAFMVSRRELSALDRWILTALAVGAVAIAIGLTWVLAIDPKSRMFVSAACVAAMALGLCVVRSGKQATRILVSFILAIWLAIGLSVIRDLPNNMALEEAASRWLRTYEQRIEVQAGARTLLTFVPGTSNLPPQGAGEPYLMTLSTGRCDLLSRDKEGVSVIDEARASPRTEGRLCLFDRSKVGSSD